MFKQYLLLLMLHMMGTALFRFIAAIGRNLVVSQTFGSFAFLVLFVLGGFVLSRGKIFLFHEWIYGYHTLLSSLN